MITVDTKLIALLGYPLRQSFAPGMFNETFRRLNLDYYYYPVEIGPDKLEAVVTGIKNMNYAGFFVTKPNKIEILGYLDEIDEMAKTIGSVNTVVIVDGGKLKGYNTDGEGFVRSLREEMHLNLADNTFLIFGAGGASRSVSFMLAAEGARKLYIIDKLDEASSTLTRDINARFDDRAEFVAFDHAPVPELVDDSNVLVNATGIGMAPYEAMSPVPKQHLKRHLIVCDTVYNPLKTRLLLDAEEVGCRIMNGIGMVVNQGATAFTLMTGRPEPYGIMREVVQKIVANASNDS